MTDDQFGVTFIALFVVVMTVGIFWAAGAHSQEDQHIRDVAEDLGCTVIERSVKHPNNTYIDCGDDNIRIIKVEK